MQPLLRFYTVEQIGKTRNLTPEGYLLCQNVPIARVGTLYYAAGEVPVTPDSNGQIRIQRTADEVFHTNAILSFAGKPVCDSHPPESVGPRNVRNYALGVVLNPHRGIVADAEDDQLLYADLLIQDATLIEAVLRGRREVSAGYDARYQELKPGEGVQRDIVGNHVAIVSTNARGRCGPVCSVGDSTTAYNIRSFNTMSKRSRRQAITWKDRIMTRFHTGDEQGMVDELEKVGEMLGDTDPHDDPDSPLKGTGDDDGLSGTHIHVHTAGTAPALTRDDPPAGPPGTPATAAAGAVTLESLNARMDRIEQAIAILANGDDEEGEQNDPVPPERDTDDQMRARVGDSTTLRASFAEMISRAEVLAPGMKHPTFDSKTSANDTAENMCAFRRRVLDEAIRRGEDSKDAIVAVLSGRPVNGLKKMTCDSVQLVYNGASEAIKSLGARARTGASSSAAGLAYGEGPLSTVGETVAAMNKRNQEFYKNNNGKGSY